MLRALGCVGSACSRGILLPAVLNCLIVERASAVAGAATHAVIEVCNVSAALLAASKLSSVAHAPAFVAVLVVRLPSPAGALVAGAPAAKYAASILHRKSRTKPSPTTPSAAGELSLASSFEMTTRPPNFFGLTVISSNVASETFSSEPSAHQAAAGS